MFYSTLRKLRKSQPAQPGHGHAAIRKPLPRLHVEILESRVLPAARFWTGLGGDANWTTAANWAGNVACPPSRNGCRFFAGNSLRNSLLPTRGHDPPEGRTHVRTRPVCFVLRA